MIKSMRRALESAGVSFSRTGVGFASKGGLAVRPNKETAHMGKYSHVLTSAQIRAARALLRWSALDLAQEAALGVNTIRRAEAAELGTSLTAANEFAIRQAFEAAGVVFIDENEDGPGVRLRKGAKDTFRK
jgi:hypothetical protein